MIFAGIVVAAAVAGASAQSLTSLSASCQAAAASVLTGPAAECLGVAGLVNVAMTSANQSFITPINNWLSTTCAQPACTNATLDSVISNLTTGCTSDLNAAGVDSSSVQEITAYIKEWYPTGREVACLQDTGNSNAYCVTTTLQAVETWIGQPLSLNTISAIGPKLAANGDVPKSLICTDCIHAAYSIVRPKLDESNRNSYDNYFSTTCGSSYTDGSAPAAIKQSANTAVAGSNGAMSLSAGMSTAATLLAAVGGLAVLAL